MRLDKAQGLSQLSSTVGQVLKGRFVYLRDGSSWALLSGNGLLWPVCLMGLAGPGSHCMAFGIVFPGSAQPP